jgi:DNA gyrase subunit A
MVDGNERGLVRFVDIDNQMRTSYRDYAMSVIVSRALPDARDGLKPVQRRILYAMQQMSLLPTSKHRKCAGVVGEVMKNFHPHSDAALYDALARMAQDFSMRYPLIDGQGNFGSVDGDPPAAMRYTEARLTRIAEEMLVDINKNTVDFEPNYDGEMTEPKKVLPARLPNLLLNGSTGIAVGMATNIPPHNINELCDTIIYLVDKPECTVADLTELLPGPDFPTGGIILGREGIKQAYATGNGRVIVRAKAYVEEGRANRYQIVVTELPYAVNKANLIEKIAGLVKDGKIDGISDLRDESDRSGMRMVIELKRDAQPMKVLNNLFKHTQLQTTFGVNMVALVDNGTQPHTLTLKRALVEFVEHRKIVIRRRTEHDLKKAEERAHILEGLKIALDHLDEVISTIRRSHTQETARKNLRTSFKLTEVQAQAILDLRLARLAALERRKIEEEYREVLRAIKDYKDILARPERVLTIIKTDLEDLKHRYGDERRTEIRADVSGDLTEEDLIPDVDVVVTLTKSGYIKRIPGDTYRTQHRGGRGITGVKPKEEDKVEHILHCSTMDSLLFFTDRGKAFQIKVHELPDASRTAKGTPIIQLINIQQDETVTTLLTVKDYATANFLTMVTRGGKIKRTELKAFASVRSSGLIALGLEEGDELRWVRVTSGKDHMILTTRKGMAIRFNETDARPMGRTAAGVNAISLRAGDRLVSADAIPADNSDLSIFVIAENGLGKRTKVSDFPVQKRAGLGVIAMKVTPRTGPIVDAGVVEQTDDLIFVSANGIVMKTKVETIRVIGRSTQGVQVMRVLDGDRVASFARVPQGADENGIITGPLESTPTNGKAQTALTPELVPADGD